MPDKLDDKIRLQHIRDAIQEIENYTKNKSFEDFIADSMLFNASIRQLEVIGEAANKLSDYTINHSPNVPWAKIVGLINVIIHNYFGIDDIMIWNVIQYNIPELKQSILFLLEQS